MSSVSSNDLSSLFMPHGHCYLWQPALVWINASTDALIFISYLAISFVLALTVIKVKEIPFQKVYLAFGLFIVACGLGHFMDLLNIWEANYWATAYVKIIAATASVGTAILLPFYLPKIKELAQGAVLVRTERALKQSEMRYEQLIAATNEGVILIDRGGLIEFANEQMGKLLQLKSSELIGLAILDFIDPSEQDSVKLGITQLSEQQKFQEIKFRRKDGEPLWFIAAIKRIQDASGIAGGWLGIFTDVTERHRQDAEKTRVLAEKAQEVELAKQFLDSVIENLPNMLFIKDAQELRFLRFNKAGEELIGVSREKVLGHTDHDLFPASLAEHFVELDRRTLSADRTVEIEETIDSPQGLRFLRTKKLPLIGPDGISRYLLGISTDITDIKISEQALIDARETAIAATKVKSEFLANMSHEIRTPLNGIIGITDLLIDSGLSSAQEEYALMVKRSGDNLLSIINDILDFSKIEAGKMELDLADFSLVEMVSTNLEVFHLRALEKNIELTFEIADAVPRFIHSDRVKLGQILSNLIGNSVKFTASGQVKLSVSLREEKNGEALILFEVKDSGIGISKEAQSRLFKPFTQADGSTARSYGGTGLGLSICKHLAEMMGGDIGVNSEADHGSCFWFTVLAKRSNAVKEISPIASSAPYLRLENEQIGFRILVAEDNPTNQVLTLALLKRVGHDVTVVANGKLAVEEFQKGTYDLILMDCQMPELDGYEATRQIRTLEETKSTRIPIVALTANAMKSDEEKCILSGMDGFLTKPMKRESLYLMLQRFLDKRAS